MNPTRRGLLAAGGLGAASLIAACSSLNQPAPTQSPLPPGTTETAPAPKPVASSVHKVPFIPVIAWHQVIGGVATTAAENQIWNYNKDCAPTAPVCDAYNNPETVSRTQLGDALGWLHSQGYASITAEAYLKWVTGEQVSLPDNPILLTTDDGTINECAGATPLLQQYGYSMLMFVVTQFADGATANKEPYAGWNLSWQQLHDLPAEQWSYAFHAGPVGHNVAFPSNPGCTYYYPSQLPTETPLAYQQRVAGEITSGRSTLRQQLGARMNDAMWAVPWNDLAQPGQPTSGQTPAAWLPGWAQTQFPVIFLQDPKRNGVLNERYRLEAQGTWTLADFQNNFLGNIQNGFFNRTA